MDYIKQLNAFEDYLERSYLPDKEELMWRRLFRQANVLCWPEWFQCDNIRLAAKVGVTEKTLIDIRLRLKQKGLIDFVPGKKGRPTKYKMACLYENTVINTVATTVQTTVNPTVQTTVNPTVQTTGINKHKPKTETIKENIKEIAVPYAEIIAYLNQVCATHYRIGDANKKHIHARWDDGYSLEDFKTVIDKKAREWLGGEQAKYLRPETLFGTKFDTYLNQPDGKAITKREAESMERRRLAEIYDSRNGGQAAGIVQSKLPAALRY